MYIQIMISLSFGNNNSCQSSIQENGRVYKLTNEPMPQIMPMIFPPPYVKRGSCVYKLDNNNNNNNDHGWNNDRDWNRDWDRNNRHYYDYDDKKPGKVYRKVTNDSIIYYTYEKYPKTGPTLYLMPVIQRIVQRTDNDRHDNNFPYWGYPNYYNPRHPYYPQFPYSQYPYPRPQYYPSPYYRPYPYQQFPYYYPQYRSFATVPKGTDGKGFGFIFNSKGEPIKGDTISKNPNIVIPSGTKDNLIKNNPQKSGEVVRPGGNTKGEANLPFSKNSDGSPARSTNPSSGCQNCKALDYVCEFNKLGCEVGHSVHEVVEGGVGEFGKYMPYILAGGGIIILIMLLK